MVQAMSGLEMGKELGTDYRLSRLRGRGAFGSVWEAQTPDGRNVALKFLPCTDRMTATQEIRAIQLVSQLRHPNLIPIDRVWCYGRYIVVTMGVADGSLLDLLEVCQSDFGTPVPVETLCPMLADAAAALDFLNARRHWIDGVRIAIQHCDIKPSNLLVFGDRVKLCDYGLASITTSTFKCHRRAGTLDYAAPEVFKGWLSEHTDQYALAVTYCQLRTGQVPFHNTPPFFDPAYVRPAPDLSLLTPQERPIIARALAALPTERWPSCGEMAGQLSAACCPSPPPRR